VGRVASEEARIDLEEARKEIEQIKEAGLPSKTAEEMYEKAKNAFESGDNIIAKEYASGIKVLKEKIFALDLQTKRLEEEMTKAEARRLNIRETRKMFNLAMAAFEREDFETAEKRIKETQYLLVVETKGRVSLLWLLQVYWRYILALMAVLVVVLVFSARAIIIALTTYRLRRLIKQEAQLHIMIEDTQRRFYKDKTLSSEAFYKSMYELEKELARVKRAITTLRSKRIKWAKPETELEKLHREEKNILEEMKELQREYFVTRKISPERYKEEFEAEQKRLTEIEAEEAAVELKKRSRRGFMTLINSIFDKLKRRKRFRAKIKKSEMLSEIENIFKFHKRR